MLYYVLGHLFERVRTPEERTEWVRTVRILLSLGYVDTHRFMYGRD